MDFGLSEEQEMIVQTVRALLKRVIRYGRVSNLIYCLNLDRWSNPSLGLTIFCYWN